MRALSVVGILLIVLGILALTFQGFTFFTQERVVDAGPFKVDWQKPHTVILHPIVGVVAAVAGVCLVLADRRKGIA
jgi:drug/metabolite transporter (DMT)-like permease